MQRNSLCRPPSGLGAFHPQPKKKRVEDLQAILQARKRDNYKCLYGQEKSDPCIKTTIHVHHIKNRGSGGDDLPENLIILCPRHHNLAHTGEIKADELRAILAKRYGYKYG